MQRILVVLLGLCACLALASYRPVAAKSPIEVQFQKWMLDHGKQYSSASEYNRRLSHFKENLKRYTEMNKSQPQARYGPDKFSDMSVEEFKEKTLMVRFDPDDACIWPYHRLARVERTNIPSTFDWRTKGAVTPVKNQQMCGSCWTFSTAENIEGQWFLSKNQLISLSEQWIVDCSHGCLQSEPNLCNGGCGGGLPWLAYEDIITNGGLTDETDYPYVAEDETCETGKPIKAKISNWTALTTDPTDIITYMVAHGPLSITLNADLLMGYSNGVITGTPDQCPNDGSDHAVLLVGYDNTNNPPYWIVKNSWGASWGESGYIRLQKDISAKQGKCGIAMEPSYPIV